MVAQIDEQHAAMVADTMAPAGKADFLADVSLAGLPAIVGYGSGAWALSVSDGKAAVSRATGGDAICGGKAHGPGRPVKPTAKASPLTF